MTAPTKEASLHELHVMLWTWLAANPGKHKSDWPEFTNNGGSIESPYLYCFACKAAKVKDLGCVNCPLQWGPHMRCNSPGSPYSLWVALNTMALQPDLISAAAKAVAELKWID